VLFYYVCKLLISLKIYRGHIELKKIVVDVCLNVRAIMEALSVQASIEIVKITE